jgi:hypothetical protein
LLTVLVTVTVPEKVPVWSPVGENSTFGPNRNWACAALITVRGMSAT